MVHTLPIKRVLAFGAHPDDCELLCGGTLARFAHSGVHVTICSVTTGEKGHRKRAVEPAAHIRQKEACQAATIIGATVAFLNIPDGQVFHTTELRNRIIELIRRSQPDLILTHWPDDYHPDHQATGSLVTECSWFAASSGHCTDSPPVESPVAIYYMDTVSGLEFDPTEYVDIGEVIKEKEAMVGCHVSQLGPNAQHGEPDLMGLMRDQARLRGRQCGVEFAEAFRPCLKWKRLRPCRMLP